jgi:hypothetical protein
MDGENPRNGPRSDNAIFASLKRTRPFLFGMTVNEISFRRHPRLIRAR